MFVAWTDQLPFLGAFAGRRRFQSFVAEPTPSHVHNLRGGYRGSPLKGHILTFFSYAPPLDRDGLLSQWEETDSAAARTLLTLMVRPWILQITKAYTKPAYPGGGSATWLLLDEASNRGALYVATWYPFSDNRHAPTE